MKRCNKLLGVFLCLGMLFCGSALAQKPIVVGSIWGITGTYAAMAKQAMDSIQMAIDEINASGGVLGRKLDQIKEDDENNPAIAARKYEKLALEKDMDFCIGSVASSATLNLMQLANKYNKVLMVPISQSMDITGKSKNKQTFRVNANPGITSGALCDWLVKNVAKNFYLLTVDYAWGRSTSEAYRKALPERGATIIGETFFPLETKDFAPYFGKIKAAKPEILFVTAAGNDAISVVGQLDQYGLKKMMTISGDGSLVSGDVLPGMAKTADGIITADYYSSVIDTPENKAFAAKYRELYKDDPSKFSVSSYEAVHWLAQAIKKAGTIESNKVIAALEGSTYKGPQGVKVMDPDSHQTSLEIYMIKIADGKPTIIGKVQ
jgi:ABC-type branched-subunit amino acid transport system substrate-binding protein